MSNDVEEEEISLAKSLAPGVCRLVKNSQLSPQEKRSLLLKLNETIKSHPEHRWLKRKEGASYNPLPARLIEILLREGQFHDFEELIRALTLCSEKPDFQENKSVPSPAPSLLAYGLDVARHLHQSNEHKRELRRRMSFLSALERAIPKELEDSSLVLRYRRALERVNTLRPES